MAWFAALTLALVAPVAQTPTVTDHENDLFKKTIGAYLTRDSWATNALAYEHGHFFMVPLHAAFLMGQKDWQAQFEAHYRRLIQAPRSSLCPNPLSRLQYLYTATRFLALSADTGRESDINTKLRDYVTDEFVDRWLHQSAIAFGHAPFTGLKARLQYKMTMVNPPKSYYNAITDEDAFEFSGAADLLYVEKKTGEKNPQHEVLQDIVNNATSVYRERGTFTSDGGWLLDVGKWADHPDQQYAGNPEITPGMIAHKVDDITMDTSHFHRWGLLLTSLRNAYAEGSSDYKFYDKVRHGLAKQLLDVVLKKPDSAFPGYRTTNYMSGDNGVYRYGSNAELGSNKGYGPYELSGTFLMGWWTFLGDPGIRQVYANIAKSFPLPEDELRTYIGPTYSPAPRKSKTWYENGAAELLTSLAAKMPDL